MTVWEFLWASPNLVFTVALVIVLGLFVIELIGLVFGTGLFDLVGGDVDFGDSLLGGVLAWLNADDVPISIVGVTFLAAFGVSGLVLQKLSFGFGGGLLPGLAATPVAFLLAWPVTRIATRVLARVLPRDETYVARHDELVGRIATIVLGEARKGRPAQAKLRDDVGQTQYFMVEPESDGDVFTAGQTVLLTERRGHVYGAIVNRLAD